MTKCTNEPYLLIVFRPQNTRQGIQLNNDLFIHDSIGTFGRKHDDDYRPGTEFITNTYIGIKREVSQDLEITSANFIENARSQLCSSKLGRFPQGKRTIENVFNFLIVRIENHALARTDENFFPKQCEDDTPNQKSKYLYGVSNKDLSQSKISRN